MDKFCYIGDMLSVDGDADAAVEARIRIDWNKLRQLVPLLTNKDVSLIMRGRLYSSCVRSSMLHGSETWPVRMENVVALQRVEMLPLVSTVVVCEAACCMEVRPGL